MTIPRLQPHDRDSRTALAREIATLRWIALALLALDLLAFVAPIAAPDRAIDVTLIITLSAALMFCLVVSVVADRRDARGWRRAAYGIVGLSPLAMVAVLGSVTGELQWRAHEAERARGEFCTAYRGQLLVDIALVSPGNARDVREHFAERLIETDLAAAPRALCAPHAKVSDLDQCWIDRNYECLRVSAGAVAREIEEP